MRDHRTGWRSTDSRGSTLELPQRPRRVAVADLLATSTLAAAGIRPVAAALGPDPARDVCLAAAGFAADGVTRLDTPDDPALRLDVLAAARPDLVIHRAGQDGPPGFPAVALTLKARGQSLDELLTEASELAVALGALPPSGTGAYQSAKHRVATVLAGRTVIFGYARGTHLSVLDPARYPWLVTLDQLGVRVLGARTADGAPHGTPMPWADVAADLILVNGDIPPGITARRWDEDWHAFGYHNYARLFTTLVDGSTS